MRFTARTLLVGLGVVLCCAAVASAAPRLGAPRSPPTVVRLRWRPLGDQGTFNVSGRYLFLTVDQYTGRGTLIDDQTGTRTEITPPSGCGVVGGYDVDPWTFNGFGGPWLMFRCYGASNAWTVELYSLRSGTWRSVDYAQRQIAECGGPLPPSSLSFSYCRISPVAVGADWLEFAISSVYDQCRGCVVGYGFQNLDTGAWRQTEAPAANQSPPPDRFALAGLGPTKVLDLDSPSLTTALCWPLRLPHHGTLDSFVTSGGPAGARSPVLLDGRFAVIGDVGSPLERLYLQRCGSSRRYRLGRLADAPAAPLSAVGSQALLWMSMEHENGLFLPSLHRFTLRRLPRDLSPAGGNEFELGARHLYAHSGRDTRVWEAPLPRLARHPTRHSGPGATRTPVPVASRR